MRCLALALALALLGWVAPAPLRGEPIVVGSKNFAESRLLGEIMTQLLAAHTDLDVELRINLGGTLVVHSALVAGEIDLYPEYTGTGWSVVLKIDGTERDPLKTYLRVRRAYQERFDLVWLDPFGFNNTYAMAIREETADELGVSRLSDLAAHAGTIRVGVSHEFLNREDGFPGLAKAYGWQIADLRGIEHGLAYEAIRAGRIDLTDAYSTDGKLLRFRLRLLEDDRRYFPPYDAAPVVRAEVLARHPEVAEALGRLAFSLDDERMQALNHEVEVAGRDFGDVAREFLREAGLVATGDSGADTTADTSADTGARRSPAQERGEGLGAALVARLPETLELIREHLALTGLGVGLAILVAVPLGILLTRRQALAAPVLNATGMIQTIPSLALLAFMIPLPGLGLGARSAIVALFLYALLPIMRNTYTGIREVDADVLEAARGMGLTGAQILRIVELPLAFSTIMAGIRTSAVISVGVATLAAFIGAGGLGEPIVTGLTLNDAPLILSGAIPAALLAILIDAGLGLVERALSPRR